MLIKRLDSGIHGGQWQDVLAGLPGEVRDVYFTPDYHRLHVAHGDGIGECMVLEEGGEMLMVPGLRVPIPTVGSVALADLQTCNGYGGPLASPGASRDFIEKAWAEWRRANAADHVVAAFFRLHPLLDNARWLPADARIERDRQTVFVDLSAGLDAAWQQADSRHRNMVNKGRREGLVVRWDDAADWEGFAQLYGNAMQRLGAPQALHYEGAYFEALRQLPEAKLACVHTDGALSAGAVFLFSSRWGHYHLSSRNPASPNSAMNCIVQSALEHAHAYGLCGVHLGGGRTPRPDDSLFAFKNKLGGALRDFHVALVVADPDRYAILCRQWTTKTGTAPKWLLGYRQPIPPITASTTT